MSDVKNKSMTRSEMVQKINNLTGFSTSILKILITKGAFALC